MSYIGNAKTPLLLASNVRDDLLPNGTNVFELSQEVPGGEAINVCVIRRRFLTDILVENTDLIEFSQLSATQSQIVIEDNYLASALSVVSANSSAALASTFVDGDLIQIHYQNGTESLKLKVESVSYTRDALTIVLKGTEDPSKYVSLGTTISKIERHYYGPWEILDPETQYEIISTEGFYNRKVEIKDLTPQIDDVLYVLHRGEGTYNFVPSPYSVGPEQLSPNLRNFAVDSESYNTTGEQTISLSQIAPAASTLIVTVDGVIQVSTNENSSSGTWTLNVPVGTTQTITLDESLFVNAVSSPVSVRVLHLSFSTVSRRAAFAIGQETNNLEVGSITTPFLAQSCVTTEKIADNSVVGSKIRLLKTDSLRFQTQTSPNTEISVLSLDQTNNDTQLTSNTSVQIKSGSTTHTLSETSITPSSSSVVSLGSNNKKFKDIFVDAANTDSLSAGSANVTGNLTVVGTIINDGVSDIRSDLDALEERLNETIKFLIPVGTIVPTAASNPPVSTTWGEWILCDGRSLSKSVYPDLYNALGGNGQQALGWPWGVCTTTEFSIPDLRQRLALGKSSTTSLGSNEGVSNPTQRNITHSHTGADHTHTLDHTHTIPGHKHTVETSSTLAISVASGEHDTNIKHSHTGQTTAQVSLDHKHNLKHGHNSIYTGDPRTSITSATKPTHSHGGTTNAGTAHRHGIEASKQGAGGSTKWVLGGTATEQFMDTENTHTHTFTTSGVEIPHIHLVTIEDTSCSTPYTSGAYTINASSPATSNQVYELLHGHPFEITNMPDTNVEGGAHTHPASSFSGFVGKTNTVEGNDDLTTSAQSHTQTSAAEYGTNRTGDATPPHLVVNYMIKAK